MDMKKNVTLTLSVLALASVSIGFYGCSDDDDAPTVDATLNATILTDFSTNVAQATYNDLKAKASTLNDDIQSFVTAQDETKLAKLRADWKTARQAWEQSESFLFGPVDTQSIDPKIDSWPINREDLNKQLTGDQSTNELTEAYIEELGVDIKGFHPIEYLVFGEDGDKAATGFTKRELEYLAALGLNLKKLTASAATSWDPASSSNYTTVFTKAGNGSTEFPTQRSAFEQLVDAMAGICEEVADEKIGSVYEAQDPSLEESPYAQNSLIDFTNNITGVQNVYLGKYSADGTSLEDLVRKYNLTLDGEIKAAISAAIAALGNVDGTFGEAISHGANVKVQNAIDAIHALHEKLDDGTASNNDLLYLVQQHTN
jgi:predicted lipoprotein